jgi:hypothetical protein
METEMFSFGFDSCCLHFALNFQVANTLFFNTQALIDDFKKNANPQATTRTLRHLLANTDLGLWRL